MFRNIIFEIHFTLNYKLGKKGSGKDFGDGPNFIDFLMVLYRNDRIMIYFNPIKFNGPVFNKSKGYLCINGQFFDVFENQASLFYRDFLIPNRTIDLHIIFMFAVLTGY